MVAISSFKPFAKSPEIAANQIAAKRTWEPVFDRIIYFTSVVQPELLSPKTKFILSENYPSIRALVAECAKQTDWACIINADIQTNSGMGMVERALKNHRAHSAVSLRWQLPEMRVVDQGLDWFAACPELWKRLENRVPKAFRMGHILWDTWMLAAFMSIGYWKQCYDVTSSKIIFHPKHGERTQPFHAEMKRPADGVIDRIKWPTMRLAATY